MTVSRALSLSPLAAAFAALTSSLALQIGCASTGASSGGGRRSSRDDSDADKKEKDKDKDKDKESEDYDPAPSAPSMSGNKPGRGETMPSVTYGKTAEENWKLGEKAFADEDYLVALRYFDYIKRKYPYSQYTALAELRVADCQYARSKYIEAIDAYQNFVRLHPTHEKVPYAVFRTGMSHYQQIPGDWFILPPSEEKDQTAVKDAERVLKDYVDRFPQDSNIAEGKRVLLDVRRRLLAHERYAANFYRQLGRDRAYVNRLQVIRKNFADVGLDDDLLLEIATVYARLGQKEDARAAVKELEQKFPQSPKLGRARAIAGS